MRRKGCRIAGYGLALGAAMAIGVATPSQAQDVKRSIEPVTGDVYRFQNNFHVAMFVVTDDGIVVDDRFRTSAPDLYAAGDVARFPAPALGPMRVEHEEHAKLSGMHAARVMAGADEPYDHLPMFYSDLFELGYEAVGRCDAQTDALVTGPASADDATADAPGLVWYRDEDGTPVGVLAWNAFGHLESARAVLREARPFDPAELRARVDLDEASSG